MMMPHPALPCELCTLSLSFLADESNCEISNVLVNASFVSMKEFMVAKEVSSSILLCVMK
jgi:hypothetical protein